MATQQKVISAAHRQINAVVLSAGLMEKTVKVRIGTQKWNAHIKKNFNKKAHLLVHDPASSLRTGDIVAVVSGWRTSRHVHHVVDHIIAPFGAPIEERPRVPSEEERIMERVEKKRLKDERRMVRRGNIVKGDNAGEMLQESVQEVATPVVEAVQKAPKVVKAKVVQAIPEEIWPQPIPAETTTTEQTTPKKPEAQQQKKSWWG
ncbi:hypothetical protein BJ878DRAFT_417909 [Calycina marina]|uniref:Ribosomal protein S17 n=1 Tax=Calycina marina TaxID=1763456 RepID=A0A9P7Z5J8_9HELO|nr:hypothetical protein BJ878DRAFT_417909 [Calycina marina]